MSRYSVDSLTASKLQVKKINTVNYMIIIMSVAARAQNVIIIICILSVYVIMNYHCSRLVYEWAHEDNYYYGEDNNCLIISHQSSPYVYIMLLLFLFSLIIFLSAQVPFNNDYDAVRADNNYTCRVRRLP